MTSWNYSNAAVADEWNEMGANAARLDGHSYPPHLPVLTFLSSASVDSIPHWYDTHERQVRGSEHHELQVLDGGHYLHWTQSKAMAEKITTFLTANVQVR